MSVCPRHTRPQPLNQAADGTWLCGAGCRDFVGCPDPACDLPAVVSERFTLADDEGRPVEHVRTVCLDRHTFHSYGSDASCPA